MVRIVHACVIAASFHLGAATAGDKPGRAAALKDKAVEAAVKKTRDTLTKLKDATPVFKRAGFEMCQVHLEVDLFPAVSVEFVRKQKISEAAMRALLEENKDNKTLVVVLQTLFAANHLDVLGYRLDKVTVRLPPRATITLSPAD